MTSALLTVADASRRLRLPERTAARYVVRLPESSTPPPIPDDLLTSDGDRQREHAKKWLRENSEAATNG